MKLFRLSCCALVLTPSLLYGQGAVVTRTAAELTAALVRRGSTEAAARELAEFGGQKAVREVLEQAEREGGEAMVRQVSALGQKHGVLALRALQGSTGPVIRALDGMPVELAENALRAIVREPQIMPQLVRSFGREALETAAKHPGLAGKIGGGLGKEGLELAGRVSTGEATILARYADDIAKLPAAEKGAVMSFIKESPGKVLSWLERHPKTLIAGSVTAAIVVARKEIFGTGDEPGMLERMAGSVYHTFEKPINIVVAGLAALVLAWAGFKLRPFKRRRA